MTSAAPRPDDAPAAGDWRARLLESPAAIAALLARVRRIAVLGIKPPETMQPAFYVPEAARRAGYEIVPVPVYYPQLTEMLGAPVYRRLADVPGRIDLVNVFRRPADVPAHLDDILAARPGAVWMQSGIRHDAVAERLAREGIEVVQDRCLMVEMGRAG
jgi:predicted CoA-binding protein